LDLAYWYIFFCMWNSPDLYELFPSLLHEMLFSFHYRLWKNHYSSIIDFVKHSENAPLQVCCLLIVHLFLLLLFLVMI
jgi:hypothetical protein